jgi:hypothetical protein
MQLGYQVTIHKRNGYPVTRFPFLFYLFCFSGQAIVTALPLKKGGLQGYQPMSQNGFARICLRNAPLAHVNTMSTLVLFWVA